MITGLFNMILEYCDEAYWTGDCFVVSLLVMTQ